jgi:NADH-quinone oxidoreductase subunit E
VLTDRERTRIEGLLPNYETKTAAAVEGLRVVQEERGWVSDEALRDLAGLVGMSATQLESLATFYSEVFRRPVGRHVIQVCDSVVCWIQGSDSVSSYLSDRLGVKLGGTTADGRFTLLPVVCVGACEQAPAMLVDGRLHGLLTPRKIDSILSEYP